MTTKDYEKAKQECSKEVDSRYYAFGTVTPLAFKYIFDRAYRLGMEAAKEEMQKEPKYNVGQRMYIKYINMIGTIDTVLGYNEEEDGIYYHLKVEPKGAATAREENLEPYTEPKENFCQVEGQVKESVGITTSASILPPTECDKDFDDIIKRGFQNERRLNIAAQILCALLSNPAEEDVDVKRAYKITDALLAESQKGGQK